VDPAQGGQQHRVFAAISLLVAADLAGRGEADAEVLLLDDPGDVLPQAVAIS